MFYLKLFKPQEVKKYFKQIYSSDTNEVSSRIPDFRNQLLWIPNVEFNSEDLSFTFFTSDNSGGYEICLEGFTEKGKPIFIRTVISVE